MSTVILVRKVVKHTKNKNSNKLMHSSKEWPKIICCSNKKHRYIILCRIIMPSAQDAVVKIRVYQMIDHGLKSIQPHLFLVCLN